MPEDEASHSRNRCSTSAFTCSIMTNEAFRGILIAYTHQHMPIGVSDSGSQRFRKARGLSSTVRPMSDISKPSLEIILEEVEKVKKMQWLGCQKWLDFCQGHPKSTSADTLSFSATPFYRRRASDWVNSSPIVELTCSGAVALPQLRGWGSDG